MNTATATMLLVLGLSAICGFILCWTVWMVARVAGERIRSEALTRQNLLDHIGERDRLEEFLASDPGRAIIASIQSAPMEKSAAQLGRAATLGLLGFAFLLIRAIYPPFDSAHVVGLLLLAAGAGQLISGVILRKVALDRSRVEGREA